MNDIDGVHASRRDTALLIERGIFIAIYRVSTSRMRKGGNGRTIPGLRAKVWIPSLHCAILGLRKFLVRAEHIYI